MWSATFPDAIAARAYPAFIASSRGRYDSATAVLERLRTERGESRMVRRRTAQGLAQLARIRGRLGEAHRQAVVAVREEHPELPAAAVAEAVTAFVQAGDEILLLERPERGVERLRGVLGGSRIGGLDPMDRPYMDAAYLYARAGRADLARQMLAERTRVLEVDSALGVLTPGREEHNFRKAIEGVAAAAEGRYDDALAHLRESGDTSRRAPWALPDIGRVHDRAGRSDSAQAPRDVPRRDRFESRGARRARVGPRALQAGRDLRGPGRPGAGSRGATASSWSSGKAPIPSSSHAWLRRDAPRRTRGGAGCPVSDVAEVLRVGLGSQYRVERELAAAG